MRQFTSNAKANSTLGRITFAMFGDMGTFAPFGHFVMKQITLNHLATPLDFIYLVGDIAYAGMNSQQAGEVEPIWDLFGELSEVFTAEVPFMPGLGNH